MHQVAESGGPGAGPNAAEDNGIVSTYNVQKYSAFWLTRGLLHKPFLDLAEQFIGPDIVLQRTSLYEKRKADVVGPFRMHQDWIYGPMEKDTMVAGMIHVARVTAPMGALRIFPGSHRTRIENGRTSDEDFNRRFPLENALVIEGEAGDVLFFHYRLVHGSKSNEVDEPRKIVHVRMFSGRDRREKPQPALRKPRAARLECPRKRRQRHLGQPVMPVRCPDPVCLDRRRDIYWEVAGAAGNGAAVP